MKIAPDKWKHFIVGILMGLFFQAVGWWLLPAQLIMATTIAFVLVVAISYGFELFSKITGHGHYEVMDAVAAVIGGILGMAIILIFQARVL